MTLKDYIIHWQEVYDKNQSRPTTYAAHGYLFKNHILHGLGEIPLEELTAEQVGDFLEERRRFGGHRPESPGYGQPAFPLKGGAVFNGTPKGLLGQLLCQRLVPAESD